MLDVTPLVRQVFGPQYQLSVPSGPALAYFGYPDEHNEALAAAYELTWGWGPLARGARDDPP